MMKLPVYILPVAGIVFLVITAVLIKKDRKKKLTFKGQVAGTLCFVISLSMFISTGLAIHYGKTVSVSDEKRMLTDTVSTSEAVLVSGADSSTALTAAAYEKALDDEGAYIIFTDQFLNRRKVMLADVVAADKDDDLSADKVKIDRFLCRENGKMFWKGGICYGLHFGSDADDVKR